MKFLKYNVGIIITAIFMACMAYKEFVTPRYGRENVPKIYLGIAVILTLLLVTIYFKYFHGKTDNIKPAKKLSAKKRVAKR